MAFRKLRIGESINITSIDTVTYTNVDIVKLEALPSEAKLNTTLADGYVRIFNGNNQIAEIEDSEIDEKTSINKFCIGSDGVIKFIVSKAKYENIELAKKDMEGYIVYYDIKPVEIIENMFVLDVFDEGTGTRIYPSKTLSLEDISTFITTYCRDLSLERGNEPIFLVKPSIKVK